MEMLDLNDANIYNEMMPSLANMEKLRHLTMIGTLITDEGLEYIRDLTKLEELDLYRRQDHRRRCSSISRS